MSWARNKVNAADESLRAVLHAPLEGLTVQDLDAILVELTEVAWRVSELALRLSRAMGHQAEIAELRLDAIGATRWEDPSDAITTAQAVLSRAGLAADEAARCLHTARQVTATIGQPFHDSDDGVEGEY